MGNFSKKQMLPIMSKYNFDENDEIFKKITDLFDGQFNYQSWAIKSIKEGVATINDIVAIKEWATNNKELISSLAKTNIVAYKTRKEFAQLFNEMDGYDAMKIANHVISTFNTLQRQWLTDTIFGANNVHNGLEAYNSKPFMKFAKMLELFSKVNYNKRSLFIKKASGYTNVHDLIKGIEGTLKEQYAWDKEDLLRYVESNTKNTSVIYNNGNIVILQVGSYADSENLCGHGRTGWCLAQRKEQFDNYVTSTSSLQFFFFDFGIPEMRELSHVGFTVKPGSGITHAHSRTDKSMMSKSTFDNKEIDIHGLLKMHNIPSSVYIKMKNLNNYKWDIDNFLNGLKNLNKPRAWKVQKMDGGIVVINVLSSDVLQFIANHSLVNLSNYCKFDSEKVFVILNFNVSNDDETSLTLLSYAKDRFGALSIKSIVNGFNAKLEANVLSSLNLCESDLINQNDIVPELLLHKYIEEGNEKEAINVIAKYYDKIDVNYEFEHQKAIFLAVQRDMADLFGAILHHPSFDFNSSDVFGENILTALLYDTNLEDATQTQKFAEYIKEILSDGRFNLNSENINMDTPINVAVTIPQYNWLVEILANNPSIDVNHVNDWDNTALGAAIDAENFDAVRILARRPDLMVRDSDRQKETLISHNINLDNVIAEAHAMCAVNA
jgi:hypothetical protein